jgi:hypothetical protein
MRCSGMTTDNRPVIAGIATLTPTHGLPLDDSGVTSVVMPGLEPGIHGPGQRSPATRDGRVKPGHDGFLYLLSESVH